MKSPRHDEDGGTEFIQRHHHLLGSLGLRHDAHFVFYRQHFGNSRAKYCLIIGQNQFKHDVSTPVYVLRTNS